MEKREKMSYCDGCRHYFKFNSKYSRYYCLAHEHERRIIPSEHKPSFCIGHTKGKEMKETATPVWGSPSSNEVKLEVGQIWQGDSGNFRIILCVGKEKVFYDLVDKNNINRAGVCEHVTDIADFISTYARKLLPCWPEKKKVSKALVIYRDCDFKNISVTNLFYESEKEFHSELADEEHEFIGFAEWSRMDFDE